MVPGGEGPHVPDGGWLQHPQEAAATSRAEHVTRPTVRARDTGGAGFRPLGVREPAFRSGSPWARRRPLAGPTLDDDPGTPPTPGFTHGVCRVVMRMQCPEASPRDSRLGPPPRIRGTLDGLPSRRIEHFTVEALVTGRLHPRSRGRPEPPPPGVPHVRGRTSVGRLRV